MLSKHAHDCHYQNADPTTMLPSVSKQGSSLGSSVGTGNEEGLDEGEPTAQDLGYNKENDRESDHEVNEEEPNYFSDVDSFPFHEETDFDLYLPPSDVPAQLEAWLGPALQKELHSISTSLLLILYFPYASLIID